MGTKRLVGDEQQVEIERLVLVRGVDGRIGGGVRICAECCGRLEFSVVVEEFV
jgi:hypothetical protein